MLCYWDRFSVCLSVCLFVCLSVCLSVFASATRLSCSEQADDFAESIYTTRWTRSRYSSALNKSKMVQDRAILTLAGTITVNVSRSTAELSMGWVDPRVGLGQDSAVCDGLGWVGSGHRKWTHGQLWSAGIIDLIVTRAVSATAELLV